MNIDANVVIAKYDKFIIELNRKCIMLEVENDMLKQQLELLKNKIEEKESE